MPVSSSKKLILFAPPNSQNFSLPENIIFYISKNPLSIKIYKKLIQTCKYFISKNYIIPIYSLSYCSDYFHYNDNNSDKKDSCKLAEVYYKKSGWLKKRCCCSKFIDVQNAKYNLWLTNELTITLHGNILNLIQKVYQCDIKILSIFRQEMSYDEFMILVSSGKINYLRLYKNEIKYKNNGNIVPFETIIAILPKLQKIFYNDGSGASLTSETAKNLLKISHLANIKEFLLAKIPEDFDFETFFDNSKKILKQGEFYFHDSISENYQHRLQTYVDKLIQQKTMPRYYIKFPGQSNESQKKLSDNYFGSFYYHLFTHIACFFIIPIILRLIIYFFTNFLFV